MYSTLPAVALSLVVVAGGSHSSDDGDKEIRNSVVKVHATQRLPDMDRPWNNHYTQVVAQVNGVRIRNLRHLVETLRDSQDQFLVFQFAEPQTETLVLDRREALAVTDEILSDNGIRQPASDDMLDLWKMRGGQ